MKRVFILLAFLASPALASFSGYSWQKMVTISSSNVAGDLTNFPVVYQSTDVFFSSAAIGGRMTNSYDLIASTNSDCSTSLFVDTESVNSGVAGSTFTAWVNLPSIGTETATAATYYWCAGNSSVTSYQGNAASVYDSDYKLVAHLPNGTTLSVADSTKNQTLTNNLNTAGDGQIDGAALNSGGNTRDIRITSPVGLYNMAATTYSAWIFISSIYNPDNDSSMSIMDFSTRVFTVSKSSTVTATIFTSGAFRTTTTSTLLSTGTWTKVDATWDSAGDLKWRIYINGTEASYSNQSAGTGTNSSDTGNFAIGSSASNSFFGNFDGGFDEVRVSDVARSAAWILTEYNNQFSPKTFSITGPETSGTTPTIPALFFGDEL